MPSMKLTLDKKGIGKITASIFKSQGAPTMRRWNGLTIKFQRKRERRVVAQNNIISVSRGLAKVRDYAVTPPGKLLFTSAMMSSNLSDRNTTILLQGFISTPSVPKAASSSSLESTS